MFLIFEKKGKIKVGKDRNEESSKLVDANSRINFTYSYII